LQNGKTIVKREKYLNSSVYTYVLVFDFTFDL